MAVMYANALYQRNLVKEGYKVISSLYHHLSDFSKSKIYPGIPEYIGDDGRGLYHYLTGSASWLLLTVLTEMFGVKGYYGDLCLEPKLMLEQFDEDSQASAQLEFAERQIKVIFNNKDKKDYEDYKVLGLLLNGETYKLIGNKAIIKRQDIDKLNKDQLHIIEVELL